MVGLSQIFQGQESSVIAGEGYSQEEDCSLIKEVKRGDVKSFSCIVEKYKSRALRLAYSFTRNWQDAEDLSQEAFVKAYYSLAQLRDGTMFHYWFNRILINQCLQHRKKSKRMLNITDINSEEEIAITYTPEKNPVQTLLREELGDVINEAITLLSPREKVAFILTVKEEFLLREAAEMMGCKLGTVKALVFRAVNKLRNQIKPYVKEGEMKG